MASISSVEGKYNQLLSDYENNVNSKVATSYESSKVFSDDSNAIKSFESIIESINNLSYSVNNVIGSCPSNFDVTHSYLEDVKNYIGKGINQITALNDRIKIFSLQVYDEYRSEFDGQKDNYLRFVNDGNGLIQKAKSAHASAIKYRDLASKYSASTDVLAAANAATFNSRASEKEAESERYVKNVETFVLPSMEEAITNMVLLLDKGLLNEKK